MLYRREVDGLRAVAVLSVIFYHANLRPFGGGFIGVDIFFVISGYLITTIILAEQETGQFSLIKFYERRMRRILPALFFVILICLPFAWLWLFPQDMHDFAQSVIAVTLYVSNVYFWLTSGYFAITAETKPLLHAWSLAVEEQYYLVFPLFLMVMRFYARDRKLLMFGVVALFSLLLAQWSGQHYRGATFFLLPTRAWEFLIGGMVSLYMEAGRRRQFSQGAQEFGAFLGAGLILYGILSFNKETPHPSFYTLVPTVGVALLIIFASNNTLVGRMLATKPFVGIGLISYSAYLWHWPLFVFARHRSLNEPTGLEFAALSLGALLLGYLSWKYIERPFRQPHWIGRKAVFAFSAVATCGFLAIGIAGHLGEGYRSRFSSEILTLHDASSDKNPRQAECNTGGIAFRAPSQACTLGDANHVVGALIGDSHADVLSYALSTSLSMHSLGIKQMTYGGCAPSETFFRAGEFRCGEYNKQVVDVLNDERYKNIIVMARWTIYLEGTGFDNGEGGVEQGVNYLWVDGGVSQVDFGRSAEMRKSAVAESFKKSVRDLLARGKRVFLVYPVPEVGWDVSRYAAKKLIYEHNTTVSTSYDLYLRRNAVAIATFDSLGSPPNLYRIYPDKFLCDDSVKGRCSAVSNGVSFYYDDDHLSNAGARFLASEIVKAIGVNQR